MNMWLVGGSAQVTTIMNMLLSLCLTCSIEINGSTYSPHGEPYEPVPLWCENICKIHRSKIHLKLLGELTLQRACATVGVLLCWGEAAGYSSKNLKGCYTSDTLQLRFYRNSR